MPENDPHKTDAQTSGIRERAREKFDATLANALVFDEEVHLKILFYIRILVLCMLGFVVLAALAVTVRTVNYYTTKARIEAQAVKIAEQETRIQKLRAELAIRDARFLAIKDAFRQANADPAIIQQVQIIADDYAMELFARNDLEVKTTEEIRRGLCERYEQHGFRCVP